MDRLYNGDFEDVVSGTQGPNFQAKNMGWSGVGFMIFNQSYNFSNAPPGSDGNFAIIQSFSGESKTQNRLVTSTGRCGFITQNVMLAQNVAYTVTFQYSTRPFSPGYDGTWSGTIGRVSLLNNSIFDSFPLNLTSGTYWTDATTYWPASAYTTWVVVMKYE